MTDETYDQFKSRFSGLCPYSRKRWEKMKAGEILSKPRKSIRKVSEKQKLKISNYRSIGFKEYGYICLLCGLEDKTKTGKGLIIHHRNGNRRDDTVKNLCVLCPNCHDHMGKEGLAELEEKIVHKLLLKECIKIQRERIVEQFEREMTLDDFFR